jgi:hypothetical protein
MKRFALVIGLALALATTPAAAQTRIAVAVGFGVPRRYVSGLVVVGRPYPYFYYPAPTVVLVPVRRPYVRRAPFLLERLYFSRRHHRRESRFDDDD